jgi:hypothetical protein
MVKIGIVGNIEQLGSNAEYFLTTDNISISGLYHNGQIKENIEGITSFSNLNTLLDVSDAIFILASEQDSYEISIQAFRNGKHVFLEQISTLSVDQIGQLLKSRKEANVKCMVGSKELCHPAFLAISHQQLTPLFIESQRSITYNKDNTKNIILDLMMKDIAVVLNIVKSDIKRIWANGHKILGDQTDMANARLEFSNGCVAVLSVDKNSQHNQSHLKIYEEANITSIDFELSQTSVLTIAERDNSLLTSTLLPLEEVDPFRYQLENFRDSILTDANPLLKLREGYEKLDIAHKILKKILSSGDE